MVYTNFQTHLLDYFVLILFIVWLFCTKICNYIIYSAAVQCDEDSETELSILTPEEMGNTLSPLSNE